MSKLEDFLKTMKKKPRIPGVVRNYARLMGQENRLIANMEKTPQWADMPGNSTLNAVGDRDVPMRTTGHGKERFTVSVCFS